MPRGRYPNRAVSLERGLHTWGEGLLAGQHAYSRITHSERASMSNATNASRHRARLHILRDRLQRAERDLKRGIAGAKERVAAHSAKRAKYRAENP